ncbi:MAG: 3-deoxy-manno-octulosonate cytidylyltransferase [Nitrospinota bacterium]|nr:3-deoxy-manno-octulosonate cytidylyltransferase [Nitrospinota bacterium]
MKTLGVIPVRWESSRFPGKPLLDIFGKTMIEHVYRRVSRANLVDKIIVATDDKRIFDKVKNFGGSVKMTSSSHESGTDRVAEIANSQEGENFSIVVNIQGDEPFVDPDSIDAAVQLMFDNPEIEISTLAVKISSPRDLVDPGVVKVIFDKNMRALYFSRAPIPYVRDLMSSDNSYNVMKLSGEKMLRNNFFKHLGLYVYRKKILERFSKLPKSIIEECEALEQLRALEDGMNIAIVEAGCDSVGIDTPEDLERIFKDKEMINAVHEEIASWQSISS